MFAGTYTALVTPFRDGKVDEEAFRALVRAQIQSGIDGIVPCGSTGESATLSHGEHQTVISIAIEEAAGRVRVIAGTGSNNTAEAVTLTKYAAQAGADGVLLIAPYYNKPTQEGLFEHYRAIADAADIPQILYNIPGRSAVNMEAETIARLAVHPNIVAVKEASGSLDHAMDIIALAPADFAVISGDDSLTLPLMSIGARGVISVTSNLVPEHMCDMVNAASDGDFSTALSMHRKMLPLFRALFLQTNPVPVKTALAILGRMGDELRLPMTPLRPELRDKLQAAMTEVGLC